ncbi:hypothetical protein HanPI659440_Chr02g0038211 [Helianthus annuus]|nr:hypothetical protein HanPI659440_Chr02g0038211 [Helianthus annuus]
MKHMPGICLLHQYCHGIEHLTPHLHLYTCETWKQIRNRGVSTQKTPRLRILREWRLTTALGGGATAEHGGAT